MFESRFREHENAGFRYLDEGSRDGGRAVVFLHGMIGGPGHWDEAVPAVVRREFRALVPRLPVYDLPRDQSTVPGLVDWVLRFMDHAEAQRPVLVGNSLGGHVAAMLALHHPDRVGALALVGASGVREVDMGVNTMRRRDRSFIREKAELTFHDPVHVTEPLIDGIIATINDRMRALRLIRLARSAKSETITDRLHEIAVPTLVVWGRQDVITPPSVAETLQQRVPDVRLHWLDKCGHAPMMEHPDAFSGILEGFLGTLNGTVQ